MSPRQKKRLQVVFFIFLGCSVTMYFALNAYESSIEYFLEPQKIVENQYEENRVYRIAGLVKKGSHQRLSDGITHQFTVTDCEYDVLIQYTGILPDLFREGQAIVATGTLDQNKKLTAKQVLAKHDENYIPKEAAEAAMKAQANKCLHTTGKVEI